MGVFPIFLFIDGCGSDWMEREMEGVSEVIDWGVFLSVMLIRRKRGKRQWDRGGGFSLG